MKTSLLLSMVLMCSTLVGCGTKTKTHEWAEILISEDSVESSEIKEEVVETYYDFTVNEAFRNECLNLDSVYDSENEQDYVQEKYPFLNTLTRVEELGYSASDFSLCGYSGDEDFVSAIKNEISEIIPGFAIIQTREIINGLLSRKFTYYTGEFSFHMEGTYSYLCEKNDNKYVVQYNYLLYSLAERGGSRAVFNSYPRAILQVN